MYRFRLDRVGYEVGTRYLELSSYREKVLRRKPEILEILRFIHNTAWPYMFGKSADDLQQAAAVRWAGSASQQRLLGMWQAHKGMWLTHKGVRQARG